MWRQYLSFYQSKFVQDIAHNKKWTITTLDKKKPLDMYGLKYEQKIYGALYTNELSLISLPDLCELVPNATNNTYFLDALVDKYVILDIEPKCPQAIKEQLLKLPYIYGETSMSGNGYHLVFPLPDCLYNYPIAMNKVVMKEEHGYYEILLNHYVTFTRNTIQPATGNESFEEFFENMAKEQKETKRADIDITIEPENIPHKDTIMSQLLDIGDPNACYSKSVADFHDDMSKYEYGLIGFHHYKLKNLIRVLSESDGSTYSDNDKAWILYEVAQELLEHRDKHDSARDGLPWLLYLSQEIIAKDNARNN